MLDERRDGTGALPLRARGGGFGRVLLRARRRLVRDRCCRRNARRSRDARYFSKRSCATWRCAVTATRRSPASSFCSRRLPRICPPKRCTSPASSLRCRPELCSAVARRPSSIPRRACSPRRYGACSPSCSTRSRFCSSACSCRRFWKRCEPNVRDYTLYGLLISVVVIIVRILWVFPATYLPSFAEPAAARTRSLSAMAERGRALVGGDARHLIASHRIGVAVHAWRWAVSGARRNLVFHRLRRFRYAGAPGSHARSADRMARRRPRRAKAAGANRRCASARSKRALAKLRESEERRKSAAGP